MKVLSVNVGRPRTVQWQGRPVSTAIDKVPVPGRVRVTTLNLDGDRQADLAVHGGWEKAVYVYPSESYARWARERPDLDLPWRTFGENLTTEGLLEEDVHVGDRFRIGSAEFVVTEPRLPCYKLGIRVGRPEFVEEFLARGLYGFYVSVLAEGEVGAGDEIVPIHRHPSRFPVGDIARLYAHGEQDADGLRTAASLDVVPESWRGFFRDRLARLERRTGRRLLPPPPPPAWDGYRPLVVRDRVRESRDVVSFVLADPGGAPLPAFRPGQYLTIRADVPSVGETVRSYSLSSAPSADAYRLTVRRIPASAQGDGPGRMSSFLHDRVAAGTVVDARAPAGTFTLDPAEHHRPVVLLGAGIGVTPLLSMLDSIVEGMAGGGRARETWLVYGFREHEDQLMREHLEAIARDHPSVRVHLCHSRQAPVEESSATTHHVRRVGVDLLQELLPASYYDYYLCGPGDMMQSVYEGLAAWGVPEHRIHYEAFGPATVRSVTVPPVDLPDCGIDVAFARTAVTATWTGGPVSLLELAEDAGVQIPFGCRAGSCGTCVTQVTSGEVAYLKEPSLPVGEGQALPCVAVPAASLVLDA